MALPKKQDCLDDLSFLDEIEGWSVNEMARTVGRMIQGADHIAQELANAAASMHNTYSLETPADPRALKELATALKETAKAIESYSAIYSWCLSQGQTGKENVNALRELLPYLDTHELRQLQAWQDRMDAR